MELRIDSAICDTAPSSLRIPGWDARRCSEPDAMRSGRSMKILIPATPHNAARKGLAPDIHASPEFNLTLHRAEITEHGMCLFRGTARLLETSEQGMLVEIREGGYEWAKRAAAEDIAALDIPFSAPLEAETIARSWAEGSPVVFLPIHRDTYRPQSAPSDLMPMIRMLSTDDYHPFLNLRALIRAIFGKNGYTPVSSFLDSPFFRSLYISGGYDIRRSRNADNRMGFHAGRTAAASATADPNGRVYTDPARPYSTVGNFVDTATPGQTDDRGEVIPDLKNNGDCFKTIDGQIAYQPPVDTTAQFEYRIRYTTDHRIKDRERLAGFDTVFTGQGKPVRFVLPNRYRDHRNAIRTDQRYRIIVFAHSEGNRYRLILSRDNQSMIAAEFSTRTHPLTTPQTGTVTASRLLVLGASNRWVTYTGDWALYDGHIDERGETMVEFRIRSDSERLAANRPRRFNRMYFGGAEPGMKLTLAKECTLDVLFTAIPGYGSPIGFGDVARIGCTQLMLLEAVAHLFNLRFFTQEEARKVYIEPRDEFHEGQCVADWRDKVVLSEPVIREERAAELHEYRYLGYRSGVGAVARFNLREQTLLGQWKYHSPSYAALAGSARSENPLFEPSLSTKGCFVNAPSASILEIGDRDREDDSAQGRISARIVHYDGLVALPDDEQWSSPAAGREYPRAWFHDAENRRTLCFEDRDGAPGLNRRYVRQFDEESRLERITLTLRLTPAEFAQLGTDHPEIPNLRSVFLLATGHGDIKAVLRRTEEYDPEKGLVVATFDRIAQD